QRAAVRLFAQHAAIPKRQPVLPSACRIHIDSGPQTAAAYVGEAVPGKARQTTAHQGTELFGSLLEFPARQYLHDAAPDRARHRISAERRSVLAGVQYAEYVAAADDGRNRDNSSAESLA